MEHLAFLLVFSSLVYSLKIVYFPFLCMHSFFFSPLDGRLIEDVSHASYHVKLEV